MPEIRIQNVEALGKPLGQYSHLARIVGPAETLYIAGFMAWRLREFPKMFPDGKYPPNTLLIIDRLCRSSSCSRCRPSRPFRRCDPAMPLSSRLWRPGA